MQIRFRCSFLWFKVLCSRHLYVSLSSLLVKQTVCGNVLKKLVFGGNSINRSVIFVQIVIFIRLHAIYYIIFYEQEFDFWT